MYNPGTGNFSGDWFWEQSRLGTQGWSMGVDGNPSGTRLTVWEDVTPPAEKAIEDAEWTYLIRTGKAPADLFYEGAEAPNGRPGAVAGGYHFAYASDDIAYCAIQDRVIVSTNMSSAKTFTNTALTNKSIDANAQTEARSFTRKGSADLSNPSVYYIGMGDKKFWYTLDQGGTFTNPAWLPDATHPASKPEARHVVIVIDTASAMTGGATSRRSRIAVAPCGQGIWLTTDGMVTGTKISTASGPGKIEAVSCMEWIAGKLHVAVIDKSTLYYDEITSAATGGAGTGVVAKSDNVRIYDPSTGTWSILAHGGSSGNINIPIKFFTKDPRYTNGYFMWLTSGDAIHTQNGTAFTYMFGNGGVVSGRRIHMMARTKPRFRPAVAKKYTYEGVGFAISNPRIIGSYLYWPLGLGPVRTPIAGFPTVGFNGSDDPTGAKFPLCEEDTAGVEAKVGQCALFVADELWFGAQDVPISRNEDGRRGHKAVVYNFPTDGSLSDALSMARGHVSGFAVTRRHRRISTALAGNTYTLDGKTWTLAPFQPPTNAGNNPYVPGGTACGAGYATLDLPGFSGMLPYGTPDIRSQPWVPLKFFIGSTELDMNWDGVNSFNGLQGATFASIHDLATWDASRGKFCVVLIGSGTNANDSSNWVYDPLGKAGIYECDPLTDWPNFRRVYAGHPAHVSNFGLYDCKLLAAPGYLIFASNYLLNGSAGAENNKISIINTATWAKTIIDYPANFTSITLGDPYPGDTLPCLFGLAWNQSGQFGLYFSRNWNVTTPTWKGPFSVPAFGFPAYLEAKRSIGSEKKEWGLLATALKTRGHAFGRYQG